MHLYRFIEGIDNCMQEMSPADIEVLGDLFAVNVLAKGQGNSATWPTNIETVVDLVSAVPNFGANQRSYMLGEGSQITTTVAPRDAGRDLRYVVTWGATSSPTIFLSAAPSGTHPGLPPGFLQVIGYDQQRNLFNFYEFVSNPDQPTRSWAFAGNSDNARNPQTRGKSCMQCHINGSLNMKELVAPWNNWNSPSANISPNNIPAAVAGDPLYTHMSGADQFQTNFQGLQTRYSQGLVSSAISSDGTISNVSELLRRLITTTTVNFTATPRAVTDTVQIPSNFFLAQASFGTGQVGLAFGTPQPFTVKTSQYKAFLASRMFALQQLNQKNGIVYQQAGGNFFPLFVPVQAYEDVAMMQQMINQKVIDANFAASVLLVDFPNPVFSATRDSLMKYANKIVTANRLSSGTNRNGIPAQFIALIQAAVANQPSCTVALLQCTAEQQFLFYAGQSDWKTRATNQVNPYLIAVTQRLGTPAGMSDYLTLWASRQAQFAAAPGIGNLDEFSLLLPCNDLALNTCKRMNVDGTISDDPLASCVSQTCALRESPSISKFFQGENR